MSNPRQFRGFGFFPGFFFNGKTGQHPRRNQSKNTSRAAEKEVPFAKKISRLAALGLRDGKQPFTTWTVNPMISVEKEEVSFLEKMYGDYLECLKTLKRRPVYSTTKLWYDMYVLKTTCCFFASGHFMNSTPQSFAKFFWCSTFLPRKNKYLLRSIKNPGCLIEILIFMVYENHPYIPWDPDVIPEKHTLNKQPKRGPWISCLHVDRSNDSLGGWNLSLPISAFASGVWSTHRNGKTPKNRATWNKEST